MGLSRAHVAISIAVVLLSSTVPAFSEERVEYQSRSQDYPAEAHGHPLVQLDLRGSRPSVSFLRYEEVNGSAQPRFDARTVPAGQELAIRGYWISKSLLDAYRAKLGHKGFAKGADAAGYDEILKAFRTGDAQAFTALVARLDELRRNPENEAEAVKARDALDPKRKTDPLDYFDRAVVGTGMMEVEDPAAGSEDSAGLRRFIPLSLILEGKVAVDPQRARVKILQSVASMVVAESLLQQDKEKVEAELAQRFSEISCRASPCATQGATFSRVLESLLKAGTTDNASRFNIMDPKYDEKLERAERDKLNRILRELKTVCLP